MSINTARKIEHLPLADLTPYARNARTHSPEQVRQIVSSMEMFGFTNPVLIDADGIIIAGHGRVMAATELGLAKVPCIRLAHLTEEQKRAYILADNKLALNAGWDEELLRLELADLQGFAFDLDVIGFNSAELDKLLEPLPVDDDESGNGSGLDKPPPVQEFPVSRLGDVWQLGKHRIACGDSTDPATLKALTAGAVCDLLHADPPYGMGKAAQGVENDNLYQEKLDSFQMKWWRACRPFLSSNASAYIWGNAPDLWRLWYAGGLATVETLELRNEIVWDKRSIPGMASDGMTQYPIATERCLFFQVGAQFLGNVNSGDFPESWEPLRSYMAGQAESAGIKAADIKKLCNCQMFAHWFTRSQFTLIPYKHYRTLGAAYPGHFARPWSELKSEWQKVRSGVHGHFTSGRSYFNNAHDIMNDVWHFPRVVGEDRHGHATPKPVAMIARAIKSSLPRGAICLEPFSGSGTTLIACEQMGRICYTVEITPQYVDVAVRRWQELTGHAATLDADGRSFAEVEKTRS